MSIKVFVIEVVGKTPAPTILLRFLLEYSNTHKDQLGLDPTLRKTTAYVAVDIDVALNKGLEHFQL